MSCSCALTIVTLETNRITAITAAVTVRLGDIAEDEGNNGLNIVITPGKAWLLKTKTIFMI